MHTLDLTKPCVMGILNITDNSFCSRNRTLEPQRALDIALTLQAEGAAIIDVGAQASNPAINAAMLNGSHHQEIDYLMPVLELLQRYLTTPFSVDTSRPEVMLAAANYGMSMINDVRALSMPGALETAVQLKLPVCLMHMKSNFLVKDIVAAVKVFLNNRIQACIKAGIVRENIVIDPGFGAGNFGKNCKENLLLLNKLDELQTLELPILVGLSRKTFIGDILKQGPDERLYGSIAAAVIAVMRGAKIIRTHDVKPTKEAIQIAVEIMQQGERNHGE